MNILNLKIKTPHLEKQTTFYQDIIGLALIKKSNTTASFQIGSSELLLEEDNNTTPYHFAINIPSNQEEEALTWLKERVEILKDGEHEIQDFDFWNAKAMYFYDEDKNIVELIARKNLEHNSTAPFSINSLVSISEIGVPTNNIEKLYSQLNKLSNIQVFDGSFERFCAIGDENGLFIAINKNVKDWFPTNDKAYASQFEISLLENGKKFDLAYNKGEITKLDE